MKMTAGRTFLLWLLAMLAGAAIVWNTRFTADMSFFLPSHPTAEQQVLVDQLKEGVVSRLLMLAIEGGDAEQRAAISRNLRGRLAKMPEFVSVQNGEAGSQDADRAFLFKHRYLLSPAISPERFTVAGLQAAIANSIDLLASPAGMMLKPMLARDPTGELIEMLSGLNAGAQPNSRNGVWASRDGERAMLLVQTQALGSDTDGQEAAINRLRSEFAASAEAAGVTNAKLQLSGPGLFAVNSRATIKDEVSRLSLISSLAIIAVLLFVYRSFRLLGLGLLPVVSGALGGVVAVSLAYGSVFGITVGFGAALIGESVDYSIYYFVQSGKTGLAGWRERFWPTIRLGVLTSVCGFGALLFSGFPGLAQLGLVCPERRHYRRRRDAVCPAAIEWQSSQNARSGTTWPATGKSHPRHPLPALAGHCAGAGRRHDALHPARRTLEPGIVGAQPDQQADQNIDMALRADIGAPDSRYLVVINAADREAALQAAEKTGAQLDQLVSQGLIGGYDSPARFLPSQATQAAAPRQPAGRGGFTPEPANRPAGLAARRQKARPVHRRYRQRPPLADP
jgi:predicted exporter